MDITHVVQWFLKFHLRIAKSWTLFNALKIVDVVSEAHKDLRNDDKDRVVTFETLTETAAPKVGELLGVDSDKAGLAVRLTWDFLNFVKGLKPKKD